MDEFKIQSLIAQNKVATLDKIDPDNTYIQVGIYQRGNQKRRSGNANVYPPAAMALSELLKAQECGEPLPFKKGSVGPKVSFRKNIGTNPANNKDVIIPGKLELTRGNNGGLYNIAVEVNFDWNSPLYTYWNTEFIDANDTSWAVMGNIANRSYSTWNNAANGYAPQYVGMPAVMKYVDPSTSEERYWLIMFTEWGVGNYGEGGEFAYDRYEIYPAVEVTQSDACNSSTPLVVDKISDGVHLARQYQGGPIFNILEEPLLTSDFWHRTGVSPRNTKWNSSYADARPGYSGFADVSNLENRIYRSFVQALDGNVGLNILGEELIMHDLTTDLYWKFEFSSWTSGCGGGLVLGSVTGFDITNPGAGILDGSYSDVLGVGGTGTGYTANIDIVGGVVDTLNTFTLTTGENYTVGDVLTFILPTGSPVQFTITSVCCQGGFSYTRQVIPQSCPIKFADGSVMTTASSGTSSPTIATNATDIYVDSNFGNDGTAEVNNPFKPFQTIFSAINAAYSTLGFIGTIYVRSGVYFETGFSVNGDIKFHFETGCVINDLNLYNNGGAYGSTVKITGNGTFINCTIFSTNGINLYFEFDKYIANDARSFPFCLGFVSQYGDSNVILKGNSISLTSTTWYTAPFYIDCRKDVFTAQQYIMNLTCDIVDKLEGTGNSTIDGYATVIRFDSSGDNNFSGNVNLNIPNIYGYNTTWVLYINSYLGDNATINVNSNLYLNNSSLVPSTYQSIVFFRWSKLIIKGNIIATSGTRGNGIILEGNVDGAGYVKIYGDIISRNDEAIIANTDLSPLFVQGGLISSEGIDGIYSASTIAMGRNLPGLPVNHITKAYFKDCRIEYKGTEPNAIVDLEGTNNFDHAIYAYNTEFVYTNSLPLNETCVSTNPRTPGFVNCTASNANSVNVTDLFVPSGFTVVPLLTIPNF